MAIGYGLKTYADEYGIFDEISDKSGANKPALDESDENKESEDSENKGKYPVVYAADI
ncbi:hypothetical protein CAMRE0001_1507 [Campylobacter rectus RM3267]|uniref:Uncharacterized protein n=1 Tax=Campylobacter rectus RM3267 TaxID=553218 RepID=B9CZF1_CAMRE|nr:hypothetical protein CAMRE0001_1507 [Campylobacter rectus RM3267]